MTEVRSSHWWNRLRFWRRSDTLCDYSGRQTFSTYHTGETSSLMVNLSKTTTARTCISSKRQAKDSLAYDNASQDFSGETQTTLPQNRDLMLPVPRQPIFTSISRNEAKCLANPDDPAACFCFGSRLRLRSSSSRREKGKVLNKIPLRKLKATANQTMRKSNNDEFAITHDSNNWKCLSYGIPRDSYGYQSIECAGSVSSCSFYSALSVDPYAAGSFHYNQNRNNQCEADIMNSDDLMPESSSLSITPRYQEIGGAKNYTAGEILKFGPSNSPEKGITSSESTAISDSKDEMMSTSGSQTSPILKKHASENVISEKVYGNTASNHEAFPSISKNSDPLITFDHQMPLITSIGVTPGSSEDRLIIAKSLLGQWITIPERSESLDSQYRIIGLGIIKRAVMNRLAIPLTMFLEENNTILHCWIHTPLGLRHMRSDLLGRECQDDDVDAGKWTGVTSVVDYSIPWFENGKTVRALQQTRTNPKIGTSIETRCVLPDSLEGKIMLFNFMMIPKGKDLSAKTSADRILKFVSPGMP